MQSSFDLPFSETYLCASSAAGQVIAGLQWHIDHLSPSNSLYQIIDDLGDQVIQKYEQTFVAECPAGRLYNLALNGPKGDGFLNRMMLCKSINIRSKYSHVSFGQLLRLLYNRVRHIATQKLPMPRSISSRMNNTYEIQELLIEDCSMFCQWLEVVIVPQWQNARQKLF